MEKTLQFLNLQIGSKIPKIGSDYILSPRKSIGIQASQLVHLSEVRYRVGRIGSKIFEYPSYLLLWRRVTASLKKSVALCILWPRTDRFKNIYQIVSWNKDMQRMAFSNSVEWSKSRNNLYKLYVR